MKTTELKTAAHNEPEGLKPLWVVAGPVSGYDPEDLTVDDLKAIGWHEVMVPAHLDDAAAASFAMGIIYNTVAIESTWAFEYQVLDEDEVELELDRRDDRWRLADSYDGVLFVFERELGVYRRLTSSGWAWEHPTLGWHADVLQ